MSDQPQTKAGLALLKRLDWFASEKGDALREGIVAIEREAALDTKLEGEPTEIHDGYWYVLANDIRIMDGNHDLGAGDLAEALIRRGWT